MRKILPYCIALISVLMPFLTTKAQTQCPHGVVCEICFAEVPDSLIVSDPVALFNSLPQPEVNTRVVNRSFIPKVFSGYQEIFPSPKYSDKKLTYHLKTMTPQKVSAEVDSTGNITEVEIPEELNLADEEVTVPSEPNLVDYHTPSWLRNYINRVRVQDNARYTYMINNPSAIEYAYWDLPTPPVLLEEEQSFMAFLKKQVVPEVSPEDAILPDLVIKKIHWLHNVGALLQFSQAYVSPNWYQGGNNYLSLLLGFNWNVTLNQEYHPNLLFQSALQYKLALSSNPSGYKHKYTIAEDNFQYNLNAGLKAAKDWYYSFNLQFKTQLLNNYEEDSDVRTAAFLSPGDLNMGIGMSYNHKNKLNTFQYTLTISPLSYNLKTCISDKVDHETYSIPWNKKVKNEIGSNLDFTLEWKVTANISYKTRVFMFTDYKYFLGDWQNTFNFEINKFLSTQLFVHLRYDGSTESYGKWKKFMMREILSFGLSYTFSTKPK